MLNDSCEIASGIRAIIQRIQMCHNIMNSGISMSYLDSPIGDAYWLNYRAAEAEFSAIRPQMEREYASFEEFVAALYEKGYIR